GYTGRIILILPLPCLGEDELTVNSWTTYIINLRSIRISSNSAYFTSILSSHSNLRPELYLRVSSSPSFPLSLKAVLQRLEAFQIRVLPKISESNQLL